MRHFLEIFLRRVTSSLTFRTKKWPKNAYINTRLYDFEPNQQTDVQTDRRTDCGRAKPVMQPISACDIFLKFF